MPRTTKKTSKNKKNKKIDYKKRCHQLENELGFLSMEHTLSLLTLNILKTQYDHLHIAYHELEAERAEARMGGASSVPPGVPTKKKGPHVN